MIPAIEIDGIPYVRASDYGALQSKLQACQQANMDVLRDSDQAFERVKELDKYAGVLIESNRMLAEERDSYASRLDSVMTAFIKQQTDQDRLKEIERLLFPNRL